MIVNGDRLGESNETFFVNLSNATNATIADGQGVGTIVDDEPRDQHQRRDQGGGQEGANDPVHIHGHAFGRLRPAGDDVVPAVNGTATTGDSDYIAKSGTLTFAPGETTKTITIECQGRQQARGQRDVLPRLVRPQQQLRCSSRTAESARS